MKQLFSQYFPTPSYLNMDSLSLDISDRSIKYGKLERTSFGFQFTKYGKEKIPKGVLVSGKIEDENKLTELLKKIKEKEGLRFVRVSLPEEQIYIFILSLPQMQGQDLRGVIALQIEEHIPLKATDVIFDYDTVEEDEKHSIVRVTAISIEVIESYLSVFSKVGLTPLSFESEAQSITRAVFPKEEQGSVMVVDLGYSRTGVSISFNGKVLFTTTIDIGGFNLTEMLAKNFSLSIEKAEEMKRSYGLSEDSDVKDIFPVLLNGVSVLHDELNKQYTYWNRHKDKSGLKHQKINRIIICGGNANLSGLAEYLEASMKMKVELANVWVNIFDMKATVPTISFRDSLSYATVVGLSLSSFFNKSESVINILPPKEKRKLRRKYLYRFVSIFLMLLATIELFLVLLLLPSYFFSLSKRDLAEKKLQDFNINNPVIKTTDIENTINKINTDLRVLSKYSLDKEVTQSVFGSILENKPKGILYTQMLYSKRTDNTLALEVHGTASSRSVLQKLKSTLDANPNYKEVNLPISDFLKKSNLSFTISIILK